MSATRRTICRPGLGRQAVGLVERRTDERDARASNAVLTEVGLRRLRAARRTHHEIIRRRFLDFLSQAEMRQLGTLWHEILGNGGAG